MKERAKNLSIFVSWEVVIQTVTHTAPETLTANIHACTW